MKKPLRLLIFFFFLIVIQANAQIPVGPTAGVTWNSFRGNRAIDVIPGVSFGAFGKYPILPFLTGKAEVLYMQQGANIIDYDVLPGDLFHNNAQVIFHTLQIPIIAEFGLPSLSEEPLQPKISAGFFYSYHFYARERYNNVVTFNSYPEISYRGHENATSQYERSQYGFIGAVGAELKIKSIPVYMEFRYTHNIPPITKSESRTRYNLRPTFDEWGQDRLQIGTVSFNVAVTLQYL